jgi:hypothetical protein
MNNGDNGGKNCGSVVTLVKANGKALLFCGDATSGTEAVLVGWHTARIGNLDFLRVAHHGSGATSSRPAFVAVANPKETVISSGHANSDHGHPRWSAIRRFMIHTKGVGLRPNTHQVVFWNKCDDNEEGLFPNIEVPKGYEAAWQKVSEEESKKRRGLIYTYNTKFPIYDTPHLYIAPKPGG